MKRIQSNRRWRAALLALFGPGLVQAAGVEWSLQIIGTGPFTYGTARAINDRGQVVGTLYGPTNNAGFLYSDGGVTVLTGGSDYAEALAISETGRVAGTVRTGPGATSLSPVTWNNGTLTVIALPAGADFGKATGINSAGQVVGNFNLAGLARSFVTVGSGVAVIDLPAGSQATYAQAINEQGTVVGSIFGADFQNHAFVFAGTTLSLLPEGGARSSWAQAVNNAGGMAGVVTMPAGASSTYHGAVWASASAEPVRVGSLETSLRGNNDAGWAVGFSAAGSAVLRVNDRLIDLSTVPGVVGQGVTPYTAYDINNLGQIVGETGDLRPYVLTLVKNAWQGGSGSWDDITRWAGGITPNRLAEVSIEPGFSATITGPRGEAGVKSLFIGGSNAAIATLALDGGRIVVQDAVQVNPRGVLGGQGEIQFAQWNGVFNAGRVVAGDLVVSNAFLLNTGVIEGQGRLAVEGGVLNQGGQVRANDGARLRIESDLSNYFGGRVEVLGGELEVTGGVSNSARLLMADGRLRGDLYNQAGGRVEVSTGHSVLLGQGLNWEGGQVIVSGGGRFTVHGDFTNRGELRVSADASATFFGDFIAQGGSLTGTGTKYFEGGFLLSRGELLTDAGSVRFGDAATLHFGLGALGSDRLAVDGLLVFDGTLQLQGLDSGELALGSQWDLFDWGLASGRFISIDSTALRMAPGNWLDTSRLYVDGTVAVVPEPQAWALWLGGLGVMGFMARRRPGVSR
jgi:adhesin HecA-like repeat protein